MWFSRKRRNRKHGRDFMLDVKIHAKEARSAKLRTAARFFTILTALALIVFGGWRGGTWAIQTLVYENEAFALNQISIETDGVIPVDLLARWAGLRQGENLLALDLARVKRDLELSPLIEFASVDRILPHELRIRVSEREPVAQVFVIPSAPGGSSNAPVLFQLDAFGYAMLPLNPNLAQTREGTEWLPTLTGLKAGELRPGKRVESPQVQAALQLITQFDKSTMFGISDVRSIDVSMPQILQVRTSQGSEITMSLSNLEVQLRRWRIVQEIGHRTSKTIATLDLAVSNYVPVLWQEASLAPPFTPHPTKPSRYKKKHV